MSVAFLKFDAKIWTLDVSSFLTMGYPLSKINQERHWVGAARTGGTPTKGFIRWSMRSYPVLSHPIDRAHYADYSPEDTFSPSAQAVRHVVTGGDSLDFFILAQNLERCRGMSPILQLL